jgi:hypothetical protein
LSAMIFQLPEILLPDLQNPVARDANRGNDE